MTTAEARNAAYTASKNQDWALAASLLRMAIINYPIMPGKSELSGTANLDIAKMKETIRGYEAML